MTNRPSPFELWEQVSDIKDPEKRRAAYRKLMIKNGHLIRSKPGDDNRLPCGWDPSGEKVNPNENSANKPWPL